MSVPPTGEPQPPDPQAPEPPPAKNRRPWLNALLFLATAASMFLSFLLWFGGGVDGPLNERLLGAGLFAGSALLILGSHEMGHYLLARRHQVDSSLPYFIPLPLGFGTLGAVIRLRGRIPHKNALVDIGAAGPLAGLAVALPLLVAGLTLSHVGESPPSPPLLPGPSSLWVLAPKLWSLLSSLWGGTAPSFQEAPSPFTFGDSLLTYAMQRLVFGELPKGHEVYAHPVFIAAWLGLLVTMLNLAPVGQLDGGHLTFAWFGPKARRVGQAMLVLMGAMAVAFSTSWVVWLILTGRLIGLGHPEVVDPTQPLSTGRKVVCAVCFVFFALTLMPAPLSGGS